jgi:hypothetical protein
MWKREKDGCLPNALAAVGVVALLFVGGQRVNAFVVSNDGVIVFQ